MTDKLETIRARWEARRYALAAEPGIVQLTTTDGHPLAYADSADIAASEALVLAMNAPEDVRTLLAHIDELEARLKGIEDRAIAHVRATMFGQED